MVNVNLPARKAGEACNRSREMQHPANSALVWEGTIPDLWSMSQSNVQAVLGPTNTGKTHLAVERLCAHSSGIDRLSAAAAGARGV